MENVDLLGTFMLGLLGTAHCVGMCGPLIFAFPGRTGRLAPHLWYHFGRVATYTVLGGSLAGIGQLLAGSAAGGGVGMVKAALWLVAAALLILLGAARLGVLREPGWMAELGPGRIPGFRKTLQGVGGSRGDSAFLVLGLMLGFLPCGLSYGAFALALGTGNALKGALVALAFGLGTAPGLVLVGSGGSALFSRYRRQADILSGILMILMALKMGYKAARLLT
jgi:hypothetical protein